jgi:hypothetical protein
MSSELETDTRTQAMMNDASNPAPINEEDETYGYADYSAEDLLEQAQMNAQATIMATALFLHQRHVPLEEWTGFLGKTFALAWNDSKPWEAGEFLDSILVNLRALGAKVVSAELGIDRAEAVTTGFPDWELCEFFSIDAALAARFNDATRILAEKVGLQWEWKRYGKNTRYTVTRGES